MKFVQSESPEEEKKEGESVLAPPCAVEADDGWARDEKDPRLWWTKRSDAPDEVANGDSCAATHAVMTSLSTSLKRNLSITNSTNGISAHNLPSLAKTLKRNLSKGSKGATGTGASPNESFPLFDGTKKKVAPSAGATATAPSVPFLPHSGRPRPNFQPNQVTWVPNQPPQLFSGVGSVFSAAFANRGTNELPASLSSISTTGSSVTHSTEKSSTSVLYATSLTQKKNTRTDQSPQQGKVLGMTRVSSAPNVCEELYSEKAGGDGDTNQPKDSSPDQFYRSIICQLGYDRTSISSLSLKNYFLEYSPDQIAAYDHAIIGAVRASDLGVLRRLYLDGKTMQCSNKFGESIVHMACRKGSLPIIHFLLEEANVSLRVRDDFGRTPLHDACWASEPSFEAIEMLIRKEPDLLLLADKRGNTPLSYVRTDKWGIWCEFLRSTQALLPPKILLKTKGTM